MTLQATVLNFGSSITAAASPRERIDANAIPVLECLVGDPQSRFLDPVAKLRIASTVLGWTSSLQGDEDFLGEWRNSIHKQRGYCRKKVLKKLEINSKESCKAAFT